MNESITLYNQQNGADKVYKADLVAVDGGFMVTGWNGRRGAALKEQPKTTAPVPYAEAKKAFDSLVKKKIKDGYQPGKDGSSYVTADAGARCDISLHLLTAASEADVERYLADDTWVAQPKMDGERRPVARHDTVVGGNRNGLAVAMPSTLVQALSKLPSGTEIDGEQVGDTLHVFDAMKVGGTDLRGHGLMDRYQQAVGLVELINAPSVVVVPTAIGTEAKRAMYQKLRATRQEGIVFKKLFSKYAPGKDESQIKVKFVESATVVVDSVHPTKRSVAVKVFSPSGAPVMLGNVTIPANHTIPAVNELVEVEYLYVVSSLYQPVYKGVRTDLGLSACTTAQLKYRAGIGEDDAQNDDSALLVA